MKKTKSAKEKRKVVILTAKCDRAFVVAESKAAAFKEQKRNEKVFKKIDTVTSKLEKNLKVDDK